MGGSVGPPVGLRDHLWINSGKALEGMYSVYVHMLVSDTVNAGMEAVMWTGVEGGKETLPDRNVQNKNDVLMR